MNSSNTLPKIVIVTYNWPPRNAIGTHRPYSWARYWRKHAEVTVLTSQKREIDQPLDLYLPPIDGVRVIETLASRGANSFFMRSPTTRRLARQFKSLLHKRFDVTVDPRAVWRTEAKIAAATLAKDADVVVSTFGPAAAHLIAWDMKRINPNIKWVADYRDLWTATSPTDVSDVELKSVGKYADLLTTVSVDLKEKLTAFTESPVEVVMNGFDIEEDVLLSLVAKRHAPLRPASERPINIVHTGTLYEERSSPEPLLRALSRLCAAGRISPEHVRVKFYGERIEPAIRLKKIKEFSNFIEIVGHVPRDAALEAQRHCDLLLLLVSSADDARGVVTGKVFEYISAGKPILCIGSRPDFEIGKLLSQTKTGTVIPADAPHEIERVLSQLISGNVDSLNFNPDVQSILQYSRKRQAERLIRILLGLAA